MIINSYVFSSLDPDAQAFITAAGITDATQKTAINQLVINTKAAGIWTKMKAIYPFVGGTATTHKWNLKNPADTDAAFRLIFSGGWTHTSNGAQPNGTNGYADTRLNMSSNYSVNDNAHISFYSRTATNSGVPNYDMGTYDNVHYSGAIAARSSISYYAINFNNSQSYLTPADTNGAALYVSNRIGATVSGWRNNTKSIQSTLPTTGRPNTTMYLGNLNVNGAPNAGLWSFRQYAFASIGDGLTDTEVLVFNQIVEGYQYALGRNVNPVNTNYYNTAYNNETNAFLYASQITDNTQKNAVNTLVNDLKIAGIWTKTKAAYPMIGGTSSTHKWNLVNPQDTDAAFRLTFNGGWTHSSTGATPNGTNAFANTFLVPSSTITLNSMSLSYYSRTNTTPANNSINMGSWVGAGFHYTLLSIRSILSSTTTYGMLQTSGTFAQFLDPNSLGLYTVTRTANNLTKIFKNGILNATNSELSTANSSNSIYLGAANGNTLNYSNRECAFALITDGLTDAEAGNLYTAIQNFNTTLSRQV
jgi:hypothetical protein